MIINAYLIGLLGLFIVCCILTVVVMIDSIKETKARRRK